MDNSPVPTSGASASLRRLDWRFLLPHEGTPKIRPRRLLLIGAPHGLVAQARGLGLADEVTDTLEGGPADVVAVSAGAACRPADAARAVASAGIVHWEVDRTKSPARAPGAFLSELRRAGLEPFSIHACLPALERCKVYVPLDLAPALPWYLSSLCSRDTLSKRIVIAALQRLTRGDGRRAAALLPAYVVTAVAGALPSESLPAALDEAPLPEGLRGAGARVAMLTAGGDRVVMLPFTAAASQPGAVVKIPRTTAFSERTRHEHARLTDLRKKLPAALNEGMPVPLGLIERDGRAVSVETYIPGRSLLQSSGAWGAPWRSRCEDLRRAARWIAEFHGVTEIERVSWDAAARAEWLDGPAAEYERAFGVTGDEKRLFAAWRQAGAALDGAPLPRVWQHRDYNVWNLVRSGAGVGVVDWEGVRAGPPLCDLLHFAVHWHETSCRLRRDTARLRALETLFFGPARTPAARRSTAAVAEALASYLRRMSLRSGFVSVLLVHTFVELALRRRRQQIDLAETASNARAGNRNFPYLALLARRAPDLFGSPRGGVLERLTR